MRGRPGCLLQSAGQEANRIYGFTLLHARMHLTWNKVNKLSPPSPPPTLSFHWLCMYVTVTVRQKKTTGWTDWERCISNRPTRHNKHTECQLFSVQNVCDPTIRQPGLNLPRQQWSLLNRFHTEQGHCDACGGKWRLADTGLCPCGETQMMSHIVESCPLTKLNDGLSQLHSADEDAVSWLISYGSWQAYEKKSRTPLHVWMITSILRQLNQLPVPQRVEFKLAMSV